MRAGLLLALVFVLPVPIHAAEHPLSVPLETAASSPQAASDLSLVYDDLHGLYGGDRYVIHQQVLTHTHRARGDADPVDRQMKLSNAQLLELARLLHTLALWEQRVPDTQRRPDESRTRLEVTLQGQSASVWERHNDLEATDRIVQGRHMLDGWLQAP